MVCLENEHLIIGFDDVSGTLIYLHNKQANVDLIRSEAVSCDAPFIIYKDFTQKYRFEDYKKPSNPEVFCESCLTPSAAEFELERNHLKIKYRLQDAFTTVLDISLEEAKSYWTLSITNEGNSEKSILPVFPCLDKIVLSEDGRMLGVNQTGAVDKIWAYPGGVYGNAADQSAQLGCLFDEKVCLGFYLQDESFIGKEICYIKPSVQVRWFPEKILQPGQTLTLPTAVITAYKGSWKQTVEWYGEWFRSCYSLPEMPDWLRKTYSYSGAWFEKIGKPNSKNHGSLGSAIDSFAEMPVHYTQTDNDLIEYAFYCKLSADSETRDEICCGAMHWHTDGVNEIREDLGGVDTLREGVKKVHTLGKRVMLYVEGLIVPEVSELFERIPSAKNWIYHNPDGSNDGLYTHEGFLHMCCGCEEWQDHLASTCARLVKETDADGIRLDSFSYYHWPCYNPLHNHKSPFDSNLWMQQLLSKVSAAVKAIKPDAILATESAIDFNRLYMNMALDQYLDENRVAYGIEDCSVFRVLFPDYYIPRINGGPVMESLQLLPDGCGKFSLPEDEYHRAANWRKAREWMGDIYTEGAVPSTNPVASREDTQCRMIVSDNQILLIAARIDFSKLYNGETTNAGLMQDVCQAEIIAKLPFIPKKAKMFDIERGEATECNISFDDDKLIWQIQSNWCCLICEK